MLKKLLVIFFLSLFAMQFVLAGETEIKLKTPEFTEIHLTVLDPDADYSSYAIYKKVSDAYGDAAFIYSGDALVFDLMVVLKKTDKTIYSNKFRENYVAGNPVYLEIIPEGYELKETLTISGNTIVDEGNATNSTEENTTAPAESETSSNPAESETSSITEEAVKNKSGILSFSFLKFDRENGESKSFKGLYIIGALVLLFAIGFFIFKNYQTPSPRKIKVTKLSEVAPPKPLDSKNVNTLIGDAEDRIKNAQKEIELLKKHQG